MLHARFHDNGLIGPEEDFSRVFTLYGHGCHLGHVTWTSQTIFSSPIPLMLHMKFDLIGPLVSEKMFDTIYRLCSHICHVIKLIFIFISLFLKAVL